MVARLTFAPENITSTDGSEGIKRGLFCPALTATTQKTAGRFGGDILSYGGFIDASLSPGN